jgi:hypothetical protein
MDLMQLPGWHIEYDSSATAAAHDRAPASGPETCGCDPCRNWAASRVRFLPEEFRDLLGRLGTADTLERSVDLCERVFTEVQDYAREKRLPIGINVESVSIRKSEIDASVELYRRLSAHLGR